MGLSRKQRLAQRIDRFFTWACLAAGAALVALIFGLIYSIYDAQFFDRAFGFSNMAEAVYSLYIGAIILALAFVPFASLPYLISSLFSENSFDSKGLALTSVAVLSSALALMFSIDPTVCARVAGEGGNCAPHQLAYMVDQFSKGGFADIFDIYDFEISQISTSELDWLGKLFTLNFRMISALYLAMVVLALYRRFSRKATL